MTVPTSEIKPRSGMKGKAVNIIHVYEDYLWSMGEKTEPPELQSISDDEYEEEEEDNVETIPSSSKNDNDTLKTEESKPADQVVETKSKELSTNGTRTHTHKKMQLKMYPPPY